MARRRQTALLLLPLISLLPFDSLSLSPAPFPTPRGLGDRRRGGASPGNAGDEAPTWATAGEATPAGPPSAQPPTSTVSLPLLLPLARWPEWRRSFAGAAPAPGGGRATTRLGGGGRASRRSRGQRQQQLLLPPQAGGKEPNGFRVWVQPKTRPVYTRTRPIKGKITF